MLQEPIVFVVAGALAKRRSLTARVNALRLTAKAPGSYDEFFALYTPDDTGCVLLDLTRTDAEFDFLKRLGGRGCHLPVVCISACADVALAVRAMKLGVADFLDASCPAAELDAALRAALRRDAEQRQRISRLERIRRRLALLDAGHREVLAGILADHKNHEIAADLRLSTRMIEVRRAKILRTMQARTAADLVRQMTLIGYDGIDAERGDRHDGDEHIVLRKPDSGDRQG